MRNSQRLLELQKKLESLRSADNVLEKFTRMPLGKTPAQKVHGGVIGEINKFDKHLVQFLCTFDGFSFEVRIHKRGLEVVKVEITPLDVCCDVQSAKCITQLIADSERVKNVTVFLQKMAQWEKERRKYRLVLETVRNELSSVIMSSDGDTIVINGGQSVSIFPVETLGGSPEVFLNGCDVSSFVDPYDGTQIADFILNTI